MSTLTPDPGIYHGVSWADYLSIPYPNPSMLKHGLRSMRRLKRVKDGEHRLPTPGTVAVGNIVHTMIAEEFEERFSVMPAFEQDEENLTATGKRSTKKTTTYFKSKAAEWRESLNGKEEVNEAQVATAKKTVQSIMDCGPAKELIETSKKELTVIAEIDGVLCKTRIDGISDGIIWDIKTTNDIDPFAFYRTFRQLNYRFQFSFHHLAIANAPNGWQPRKNYKVIAAEIQDDYEAAVVDVPLVWLESYEPTVKRVIEAYRHAESYEDWPGMYPLGETQLQIPAYDMQDTEEDLDWADITAPVSDSE